MCVERLRKEIENYCSETGYDLVRTKKIILVTIRLWKVRFGILNF